MRHGAVVFLLVFLIALASYISHRPSIRISKVELSGEVLVKEEDIELSTISYLNGSYLWLFPKDNAFLYPRNALIKNLKDKFKRIDTIDIHLKNFHILTVDITERKPEALWCDSVPNHGGQMEDGSLSERCYFMDGNSVVFAEAPQFSGDAYFKYYGLVDTSTPIGMQYLASTTLFVQIVNFVDLVKSLSLKPIYIVGKDDGEFSMMLSTGGQIYFDTKESLSKTSENLKALMHSPVFSSGAQNNIDYIDLRFGNKLFYKLKANY